jgi:TetR/AcrR family transcriptional regulator, cholesterol catabolism regulator
LARTRSPVHPEKRARLLEVAHRLFSKHGYDGTSMSKLAEEAEVTPNTLYWYFEDKDALLVEVLNSILVRMSATYLEQLKQPLGAQVLWLAQVFEETSSLVATVHTRAPVSPVVAQWHEQFHAFLEGQFVAQLRARGVTPARARHAARITSFVLEGMVSHQCSISDRREMIKVLMATLDV